MSLHLSKQQKVWATIDELVSAKKRVELDGTSLSIAALIAISRYGLPFTVSKSHELARRMSKSIDVLNENLDKHDVIYGVNTAPGGNADSRTRTSSRLQHSFFQHHQAGILPETVSGSAGQTIHPQSLSETMVRALTVVRCNSLVRGHSAIRQDVVESLAMMTSQGITPLIPTRGSISASGDLSPLSYLGGLLEGNEGIYARVPGPHGHSNIVPARQALEALALPPVALKPKEGLAIMNGTAVSTGYAALVIHDCHDLAIICQLLTSMAVEALSGMRSNFHQFISEVRPHAGQDEVASNIRDFLSESKLCSADDIDSQGLAQDRYALRTAPQWIGPQLEDLCSAEAQISVELNSTTDNPLIDVSNNCVHHGGNFQAASITSAMEKSRTAITMLGRILFAQSGELVNPDLNKGLPPNLSADDPTVSFTCKGIEINMTAYYSELCFLANSVASHVQTADRNNQSVNSLALVSSRMTEKATELLAMMSASHLFTLCQALDLRARDEDFLQEAHKLMRKNFTDLFTGTLDSDEISTAVPSLWTTFRSSWQKNNTLEPNKRCQQVSSDIVSYLMDKFDFSTGKLEHILQRLQGWQNVLRNDLVTEYTSVRDAFFNKQSTHLYLSKSTVRLYNFVRNQLQVPFHRGLPDHPPLKDQSEHKQAAETIGTCISRIFVAIQDKTIIQAIKE
ncbi:probable Phenylalanine ammonia-lyase [Fusarium fujikuroi]|nr:probable Phenylalanine ammonia-lyase [Fusarium fujikuroi]